MNDPRGTNLIQVLLHGGRLVSGDQESFMPAFGAGYSDVELAAVGNLVIVHFGDKHGEITPADAAAARNPK